MYRSPACIGCFLLCLLPLILLGQEYEVSVTSIEVWVKATDSSGKSIAGLNQNDFEIYEDNQKVAFTCFEEVQVGAPGVGSPQTSMEAQGNSARTQPEQKFVLFLDLLNMTPQEFNYVQPRLREFLNQVKAMKYEVMLAALLANGKLGIISPFTSDVDHVRALLAQASSKANPTRDQKIVDNRRQLTHILETIDEDPRMFEIAVRDAYRQAQVYARDEKNTTLYSLAALESFSSHLSTLVPGEHAVVLYISGGFNSDPGRQYFDMVNSYAEKQGIQNTVDFAMRFPSSIRETNFDLRTEIQKSIGRLNRNNITLYSINTRGTTGPSEDLTRANSSIAGNSSDVLHDYQESMWQIAKETGGTSFENTNNFKVGFDHVITDLDQQYVLCYAPPAHKVPGKYHQIKIVCKRPGVNLRHRQGYTD